MTNKKPPPNGNIYRNKIKAINTNYCYIFKTWRSMLLELSKNLTLLILGDKIYFACPFKCWKDPHLQVNVICGNHSKKIGSVGILSQNYLLGKELEDKTINLEKNRQTKNTLAF